MSTPDLNETETAVICDAITYADDINDDFGTDCTKSAQVEVLCSDGRWHPRCFAHYPTNARHRTRALKGSSDGV